MTTFHHPDMRAPPEVLRQRGAALLLFLLILSTAAATLIMKALNKPRVANQRLINDEKSINEARDALMGFAAQHGRLPRPATMTTEGKEMSTACSSDTTCTGFLPWVTLGLTASDSRGHLLRYSVTPAFTKRGIGPSETIADKRILSRDTNGAIRYVVGQETCTLSQQCSPAIVFSSGSDGPSVDHLGNSKAGDFSNRTDEVANYGATTSFMYRPYSTDPQSPGGEFDDLLTWIPLPSLFLRLNAVGTLH